MTRCAQTWEQAWQRALYAPDGFYRRQAPAQHFATATQGIPGAGAVLADAVAALAAEHGCSAVVDVGAGRGELLTELSQRAPHLRLTGVDVVARPAGLVADVVSSWIVSPGGAALPAELDDLEETLVVAHEWLDVIPCPVVQRDPQGIWREVLLREHGGGSSDGVEAVRPEESLGTALQGAASAWAERWLAPGVWRAEIGLPREAALRELITRVRSGLVLVVDYGHGRDTRPPAGTLTGFRGGHEVDPVADGTSDITAHVAIDALARALDLGADQLRRQSAALRELLEDPRDVDEPVPHALARSRPAAYMQAVARRSALRALTTGALGDFWWVTVPVPDTGARPAAGA